MATLHNMTWSQLKIDVYSIIVDGYGDISVTNRIIISFAQVLVGEGIVIW